VQEIIKICNVCCIPKPSEDYHRRTKSLDGLSHTCKVCANARRARHYETNREGAAAKAKRRYLADPEKRKAASREYWQRQMAERPEVVREKGRLKAARLRAAHPERYRAAALRWQAANPDRVKAASRRTLVKNKPWLRPDRREYKRLWALSNPEKAAAARARRKARRQNALTVPFTPGQLAQRMSMFDGCWMCGGPWTEIDHVKPLSKGGAHMLSALRPACRSDNAVKSDRWPFPLTRRALKASGWPWTELPADIPRTPRAGKSPVPAQRLP
jgi:5-methylcytosine-specific restriction endonuclease McrA